jgi:DnaJ-class molecular chaperone
MAEKKKVPCTDCGGTGSDEDSRVTGGFISSFFSSLFGGGDGKCTTCQGTGKVLVKSFDSTPPPKGGEF